jgi:hypothetical protein
MAPRAAMVLQRARVWLVPGVAGTAFVVFAVLSAMEWMPAATALAGGVLAALALLLWIGERPLLEPGSSARDRLIGAGVALVWLAAGYIPFHARLFPGTPLVDAQQIRASGDGLPLRIPATGYGAVDLLLKGRLSDNPTGGASPPVHYRLTIEDGDATPRVVEGLFQDRLMTQRLGRRGTATVHQAHTADVRVFSNPRGQDLSITHVVLEPESSQPITVTVLPHPLPGLVVLSILGSALFALVIAFDRLGPAHTTDGGLTLATAAVVGTAIIFWTSNAVDPDFHTLIGSAIFGGPLGFAGGAFVWWIAKRLIAGPAR